MVLIILVGLPISMWQFYNYYMNWASQDGNQTLSSGLSGEILLTLKNSSGDKVYKVDTTNPTATPKLVDIRNMGNVASFGLGRVVQPSVSPNGIWSTFIGAKDSTVSYDTPDSQVYRILLDSKDIVNPDPDILGQVTDSTSVWKLLPVVSNEGDVLYMSRSVDAGKYNFFSDNPDDWTIYLETTSGLDKKVALGMYPKWVNDGASFLYLASDGIHRYDLKTGVDSVMVLNKDKSASGLGTTFDVSDDGSLLVMSSLPDKFVGVYKVDLNNNVLTLVGVLTDVQAVWPVISPDNNYIAMSDLSSTPRLIFHRVVDGLPVVVNQGLFSIDLGSYSSDTKSLFVTDWQ